MYKIVQTHFLSTKCQTIHNMHLVLKFQVYEVNTFMKQYTVDEKTNY